MEKYKVIKSFPGSNTGIDHVKFVAGTVARMSDDLAAVAIREGWAKEFTKKEQAAEKQIEAQEAEDEAKRLADEKQKVADEAKRLADEEKKANADDKGSEDSPFETFVKKCDSEKLTKKQIDEASRSTFGIDLNQQFKKENMYKELEEALAKVDQG